MVNFLKSILHNIGVLAYLGTLADAIFGFGACERSFGEFAQGIH